MGIVTLGAGAVFPLHRTMTLDTILILEGVMELHLDSGEMKVVKAGDTIVQRGTMHMWKNVTPEGGKVRMVAVAQPIAGPIEVGGKKLETEWRV
ncbi:Cupin-domain-containing oxidoreductase srdD [Fulvia fulva]|uniref:Cupin-domain-containing oxidoreductase srdD n=1 Tax=Passalora fulva TaxID=5499 RepID=A0A9Q8PMU5_PASFU|nr:Cupin-domain-containing oxidoreductase srdD [Fulvia fulva]KAK4609067.1 Cupin-domain-containing oxidoreductase srdD [Fulvia fulva]KAK4609537.1 Cupin-domain-containing oxidoreductase srdD [Fulvia fulva]UJO25279.1 Cupin-domain-containing oxidoreductase srdD [Fulvia fulva]WPV22977.1 Cupin-domain-containing oxidoreductase srdD [Fulvia fulva]WPV37589.1 Cupin-domain-containing oxidoreductase srdD [Fulvia fulva]